MMEYFNHGATIMRTMYAGQITKLLEEIRKQRRFKFAKVILFRKNNAPAHKFRVTMTDILGAGFELMKHPPF